MDDDSPPAFDDRAHHSQHRHRAALAFEIVLGGQVERLFGEVAHQIGLGERLSDAGRRALRPEQLAVPVDQEDLHLSLSPRVAFEHRLHQAQPDEDLDDHRDLAPDLPDRHCQGRYRLVGARQHGEAINRRFPAHGGGESLVESQLGSLPDIAAGEPPSRPPEVEHAQNQWLAGTAHENLEVVRHPGLAQPLFDLVGPGRHEHPDAHLLQLPAGASEIIVELTGERLRGRGQEALLLGDQELPILRDQQPVRDRERNGAGEQQQQERHMPELQSSSQSR